MLRAEVVSEQWDGNQARIALEMSRLELADSERREAGLRKQLVAANQTAVTERERRMEG